MPVPKWLKDSLVKTPKDVERLQKESAKEVKPMMDDTENQKKANSMRKALEKKKTKK